MILKAKKVLFFGNFTNTTTTRISIFSQISRLLLLFFLIFSSSLFLTVNAQNSSLDKSQLPAKVKGKGNTKKTIKVKAKSKKVKKNAMVKKNIQTDIDPTSANSPLYNN